METLAMCIIKKEYCIHTVLFSTLEATLWTNDCDVWSYSTWACFSMATHWNMVALWNKYLHVSFIKRYV